MKSKGLALVVALAALTGLITMAGSATSAEPTPKCANGNDPTRISTGIAQLVGCWNKTTVDGGDVYTAQFDQQPFYGEAGKGTRGVDLNGFLVASQDKANESKTALQVNTKLRTIRSVQVSDGTYTWARLYSMKFPDPVNPVLMGGDAFVINFTAPTEGSVLLEDFRLGSNQAWSKAFDGFSPVGDVETPARISEGGKGSMDFTIQLAGIFTLKGRPQSVTIKIPTASGEGAKIDGFAIHLQEIDGIKLIKINDFEAEYSAEEKKLGGGADFTLPFMGDKGVGFSFEVEDKVLTKASVGVSGVKVPIGSAGFITALSGGFGFKEIDNAFVLNLNAGATAEFGPEVPTPWGKVVPIEVSSALKIGKVGQNFYFLFDGGVKVFRLPVGSVYLKINTASGVAFGFNIGVGFPSYANNPNDPFYIGSKVDGWVANKRFQFEGQGKVRLIGLDIFDGRILINSRAAGACWKVLWFDGGAVYEYGRKDVQTFGTTCGLDRYREAYPSATRNGEIVATASQSRKLSTGKRTVIMSVRGQDGAPRFTLTSKDGRRFTVPKARDAVRTKKFMIVADEKNKVTHVAGDLRDGNWTITPYADSTSIMGVKTGEALPEEKVEARVVGKGLKRTLIWNSQGNPHTKLTFVEVLKDGTEQPILTTDKVKGRKTFKAAKGVNYGKRRLRAYVIHGGTPREVTIEDRYSVRRPAKLSKPGQVKAWRNIYTANLTWQGVRGASGYVAEIAVKNGKGRKASSYRRVVGPKQRKIVIPTHPGGNWAIASVQALNADEVPGQARTIRFRLAPPKDLRLKDSGRRSAATAKRVGGSVKLRTLCPVNGHCQTVVRLELGGRTIAQTGFQQVPGTFRNVQLTPESKKLRRLLAQGRLKRMKVEVHQHRVGGQANRFASPVGGS